MILEIGLVATLGFGGDPQKLQDTQRPYFLLEHKVSATYTAKLYADNRIYDARTIDSLFQLELGTRKSGLNYSAGFQSEHENYNRPQKTGEVVYIKLSYRFED